MFKKGRWVEVFVGDKRGRPPPGASPLPTLSDVDSAGFCCSYLLCHKFKLIGWATISPHFLVFVFLLASQIFMC